MVMLTLIVPVGKEEHLLLTIGAKDTVRFALGVQDKNGSLKGE